VRLFLKNAGSAVGNYPAWRSRYLSGEPKAEEVDANVAKAEGTIVSVHSDRIVVQEDRVRGHVMVSFERVTRARIRDQTPGILPGA
jgi:hypothetical protein